MSDDSLELAIESFYNRASKGNKNTAVKKKFRINKIIDNKAKHTGLNAKQKNLRPNIILYNNKRIGVDKMCGRFSSDDTFNECDC
jgi:hypothetical protein